MGILGRAIEFGALAVCLAACGAESPKQQSSSEADQPNQSLQGFHAVEREYPFFDQYGQTVCNMWEWTDEEGKVQSRSEFYLVDKMNDILDGRPLADGGVWEPEVVAYIKASGVEHVASCDEARSFVARANEYYDAMPPTVSPEPQVQAPANAAAASASQSATGQVDKVADSKSSFYGSVVRINGGGCTGALIGPHALITAGHCVGPDGWSFNQIDYGTNHPELGCLSDHCSDPNAGPNVKTFRYPGFVGASDTQHDFALIVAMIRMPVDWPIVVSWINPQGYITMLSSTLYANQLYAVDGYGFNADSGGTNGVQRVANYYNYVDNASNGSYWYTYVVSGRGRPCFNDSGGPGILYDPSVNPWITAGQVSNADMSGSNGICPGLGKKFRYTQVRDKVGWVRNTLIAQQGTDCSVVAGSGGFNYVRCY